MKSKEKKPLAEIVAVGEELLRGDVVDANSPEIESLLLEAGVSTRRVTLVGDDVNDVAALLNEASKRSDMVVVAGGLGPTEDDVTREAAARAAGVDLEEDPGALESIAAWFGKTGRPMREDNKRQALLPRGARILANGKGTAPGFRMPLGRACLFALPGVPAEMRAMMKKSVVPSLGELFPTCRSIARRSIHLAGVPESSANSRIRELMTGKDPRVGLTVRDTVVTVTITSSSKDAEALVEKAARRVRDEFGDRVFGEGGDTTLPSAVARILIDRSISLATAESCTGGLVGALLTGVAGVSAVYKEGITAYSVEAKIKTLGVDAAVIEKHGQVSTETAAAMAEGAARRAACRAAIGITGIAGPGGGTEEKPVGLVCIAAHFDGTTVVRELRFAGDREMVRVRSALSSLDLLRRLILGVTSK